MAHGRRTTTGVVVLAVCCGIPVAGHAGEPDSTSLVQPAAASAGRTEGPAAGQPRMSPWVGTRTPSEVRSKVEAGFALASQRVRDLPECRRLFADLGADGVDALSTTMYYPAGLKEERRVCRRALAYTLVGGAPTWLCRRFSHLSDERAAAVLLHEALHHAGMNERPHDPDGLAPRQIDKLVEESCGF